MGQKLRNTWTQVAQKENNTRHLLEPVQDHEESAGRMNYQHLNSDEREDDGRKSIAITEELIYQTVFLRFSTSLAFFIFS